MADKIRVIIVDDIAETRENIRKLLQFEANVEVVGVARTGREAINQAVDLNPDVMLMDINMPDMDGITATEEIRKRLNWVQIIILSVQGDPNYMRKAMLAGARDYLTKPPTIDELTFAIQNAGVKAHEEKAKANQVVMQQKEGSGPLRSGVSSAALGKIVTVYSPKGGVGVTTIAANLAVTLQDAETSVAIIDGNLQFGDVAVFFNEQGKNHIGDLTPRVDELDAEIIEEVMISHRDSGLKILAAPPRPEMAEEIKSDEFSKLLGFLRRIFSYIIVDTSSSLGDITLSALDISDYIILVTTQDIPAIANARLFLDLARVLGIENDRILFAMNRYDKRINISPDRIGESFHKPVAAVIPIDSRSVVPAVNRGIPFMLDSRSRSQPVGKAIISLAQALKKEIAEAK
jgi:pilus assembly protein CpaE